MININNIYNKNYNKKYNNFYKFFKEINQDFDKKEVLPLHLVEEFKLHEKDILKKVKEIDTFNYLERLKKYDFLFSVINSSKINLIAYKALLSIENNPTIQSNLKKFKPTSGYANKCHYNNSSNISGRIIVEKGPNILTLPKRCRSIFESRFLKGKLVSVDFSNLEPRLCLKLSGSKGGNDLYEDIKNQLDFDIDIDRSIIKRAVISVLYGSNHENLKNISSSKSKKIFEIINEYFNIEYLIELSSRFDNQGIRRNYFGRPIWNENEEKQNIIMNNYIQSSAVDIALTYFSNLVLNLDIEKSVPVFIIHDAIVFDVEDNYLNVFNDIISKGYDCPELGHFPVTTSTFNSSID